MKELIQEIHKSDILGTFIEIGAGQPVAQQLFEIAGASQTIYKAESPYSKKEQEVKYKISNFRSVSKEFVETVIKAEMAAGHAEINHNTYYVSSFQIADKPGAITHGWIGLRYRGVEMYYHITMPFDYGREAMISLIGNVGIALLYCKNDITSLFTTLKSLAPVLSCIDIIIDGNGKHLINETLKVNQHYHTEHILVVSDGKLVRFEDLFRGKDLIIMKGSFNPLHNTHLAHIQETAKLYPTANVCFSISFDTYEKGTTQLDQIVMRVEMLNKLGYPVILFKDGYFANNVNYLRNERNLTGQIIFPLGSDTVNRIVKHYENTSPEEFEGYFQNVVFPYKKRISHPITDKLNSKLFLSMGEDANEESSTVIRALFSEGKYSEIEKLVPAFIIAEVIEYLRTINKPELISK